LVFGFTPGASAFNGHSLTVFGVTYDWL